MRKHVFYVLIVVAFTAAPVTSQTQPCPDERTYTGQYRNIVFGFSIIIPAGLKGYWNSARCAPDEKYGCVCMGDHGRIIPLSDESGMNALVGWEMESDWTLRDHENDEIRYLTHKPGVKQVRVLSSKSARLGTVRARRFIVRLSENNKSVVVECIIALHKGVEYELILQTVPNRYRSDRRLFDKLVASWKLTQRV